MDRTIGNEGPVDEVGVRTPGGCWNQASCNFRAKHFFLEPVHHWLIICGCSSLVLDVLLSPKPARRTMITTLLWVTSLQKFLMFYVFSETDDPCSIPGLNWPLLICLPFSLVGARYSFCHYNREIYNSNQIGICLACLDTPCFLPHLSVHFPPCFIDSGLQISCYTIFITYMTLNNMLFN